MTGGASSDPTVLHHLDGGVLTLTLHRPDRRNAMNDGMRAELLAALDQAQSDPDVRVVVLRGSGGTFCAGGDISAMGSRSATAGAFRLFAARRLIDTLVEMPKPVVAAVERYAVGAGFGLALACDIVVASDEADFRMSFISRGLAPDSATTYFLNRQIGPQRTKELALTGRPLLADEAFRIGVVAHVWPASAFDERLADYAASLAAGPTVAMGITKRLVHLAADCDMPAVWDLEAFAAAVTSTTDDHREALHAWREHRSPEFQGNERHRE